MPIGRTNSIHHSSATKQRFIITHELYPKAWNRHKKENYTQLIMQNKFNKKVATHTLPTGLQHKLPYSCKMLLGSFLITKN